MPDSFATLTPSPTFQEEVLDNDLESLSWIEDEETTRLAKELYIELMIAQEEENEKEATRNH